MSDRALMVALRSAVVIGAMLAAIVTAWIFRLGGLWAWFAGFDAFMGLMVWFFAAFVWMVAPQQARNPVVWVIAASAFFGSLTQFGSVSVFALFDAPLELVTEQLIPATLPPNAAVMYFFTGWMWVPALLPLLTLGLLLFPDGSLPTPRWRWVGVMAAIGTLLTAIASFWSHRPSNPGVVDNNVFVFIGFGVTALAAVLSVAALMGRFRRSTGDVRQQIKWILWGASIFIPVFMGFGFVLGGGPNQDLLIGPIYVAETVFLGSYGMAIAKYRLYDIDVVISRTFVYGTLAVFITVVYVGAVVGLGQLIGSGDEPNPLLAIGATAAVAVAFQPLRRLLQSTANRLVYGRRATPYEVLSTFSQRVAAVDPAVLTQIVRALVEGTTAEVGAVWMTRGAEHRLIARWPPDHASPRRVSAIETSTFERVAEVIHDREQLGLVTLSLRPGQPFSPVDSQLLDQVAAGLGLALRNLRLTEDLRARLDQLRDSRRRIVAVQDMTRRRLERDLHDGAQQRLVSLKIKLGIGSSMAEKSGLDDVREMLDSLRVEADDTIEAVRDFARGIYPPLLEAEGLGPAVTSRAHKIPIPLTVHAAGVSRYPRELEATVYFCVLECLMNAVKHSEARSVVVTLSDDDGELSFEVRDDGVGFDVDETPRGSGLTTIADRLDAQDGSLEVVSNPGKGTVVHGAIPTREMAVVG